VEVVQGCRHAGVALRPHEVDVPGQDGELERLGCLGARRGGAVLHLNGPPLAIPEGEVFLRRQLAALPAVDGGKHVGDDGLV
jgi:hypothetical protein